MSVKSAFLRRTQSAKSDRKIAVCTPSKNKLCEVERLIRGQDEILSTKDSAWAKNFCLSHSQVNQYGKWDFVKVDTLGVPAS